jgi:hypothetical protein
VAEDVGLDFFGLGAHHTASMPLSAPTALVKRVTGGASLAGQQRGFGGCPLLVRFRQSESYAVVNPKVRFRISGT